MIHTPTSGSLSLVYRTHCLLVCLLLSAFATTAHSAPQLRKVRFASSAEIGIGGRVADVNLHPLPGVTVTLKDRSGVVKTTATGPGGEYLFSCVDDGRYEVEFSLEGFFTSKVEVEYFYPSSLNVDQVLPLGLNFPAAHLRLTIKIVNARTGLPVEGASILFDGREAMSDPCGRAWWSNLEGDAVQIRVRKKGFVDLERKIPLTGQTWFWTLPLAPSP